MRYSLILSNGTTYVDFSRRAQNVDVADGRIVFDVVMDAYEASMYTDTPGRLFVRFTQYGKTAIYRLVTPTLTISGVRFEGIALDDALNDDEYSALWSTTNVGDWLPVRPEDASNRLPDRFVMDTNDRLYIAAKKNEKFSTTAVAGATLGTQHYRVPAGSTRNPTVMQADYEFLAPTATWKALVQYANASFGFVGVALPALLGSAAVQTGAFCVSFAASPILLMDLYYDSPTPTLYIGETGECYFRLTNVRIATSTTNLVSSTIALAIVAGLRTVTPAVMTNMFVGQRLVINSTLSDSESVVVTAITATTFTAVFAKSHAVASTVKAIVIRDDEIIKDMHAQLLALDPASGLKTSTALVKSTGQDRVQKAWSAALPLQVLEELAKPILYDYGVNAEGYLYYQPRGTNARAWMVKASDIELARPLNGVINSVRAGYENAHGVSQFTAYATDTVSVAANGLTRRRTIQANTTSLTEATLIRDTALSDTKKRPVQSRVAFRRLFDRTGAEYPPNQVQRGDTITIANLPAVFFSSSLRTFRVAETHIDVTTGLPSVTPDAPLPLLDVLLARLAEG